MKLHIEWAEALSLADSLAVSQTAPGSSGPTLIWLRCLVMIATRNGLGILVASAMQHDHRQVRACECANDPAAFL
jgi:hypothetical protein